MLNPAEFCLEHQTCTWLVTGLAAVMGVYAYMNLGRLSYPDFTIKTAMVVTPYSGATPKEVEELVTDVIEEAIQSMSEVEKITSDSRSGMSYVTVEMNPRLHSRDLPQVWDFLRKKIADCESRLPPGCGKPVVRDDFGDVYGVYYALTCSDPALPPADRMRWLKEQGRWLKKELLNLHEVRDIAKIEFYGIQPEVIYLEIPQSSLANSDISPQKIMNELANQNLVSCSGKVRLGDDYVRIIPTGDFQTLDSILDIVVSDNAGKSILRLRDLIEGDELRREMKDPPDTLFRFDGKPAVALGISTRAGGNAVFMGEDIERRIAKLKASQWPKNLEIHTISNQAENVTEAVDAFLVNLYESLAIVILLLMVFMGLRSGLLIGFVLLLTILGTFIVMYWAGITLQIISLGALIIALGMLVDNAIVIQEEILIRIQKGVERREAAVQATAKSQRPLLGATMIAILAFAALGFAPDNIGEFCLSMFQVLAISLLLSWVTAVTILPMLCIWALPVPKKILADPYDRPFYRGYRRVVECVLKFRYVALGITCAILAFSFWEFQKIPEAFFGNSTRPQFFVDYWRTEGTAIEVTNADTERISAFLRTLPGVRHTACFIGSGSLRYILSYEHRDPDSCFSQVLVTVDDFRKIPELARKTSDFLAENFPDAQPQVRFFREGPSVSYSIELEFRGRDSQVLHQIANDAKEIFSKFPETIELRDNWLQRTKVLRPEIRDVNARRTGINRATLSQAILAAFVGTPMGYFRDGEDSIPILWRLPNDERGDIDNLGEIQIFSTLLQNFIRLDQLSTRTDIRYEDPIIRRVDRKPAITVQCNAQGVPASVLRKKIEESLKSSDFQLPPDCEMTWRGEFEASNKGKEPLARIFPLCFLGMFLVCVAMYDNLKQPVIIFLTVPLAFIGVALGLILSGNSFEFLCIPACLGLTGMLIKNAIVLVTDTDHARAAGLSLHDAVVSTAVSRFRPILLASTTTILGIAPLLFDPFYSAMAATICGGLLCATLLTLLILPIFYRMVFRAS